MTQAIRTITDLLTVRSATNPRDRELLLAHVLRKPREWILAHSNAPITRTQRARYARLLNRLARGEPLPHLLGEAWFYGRPFTVNRHVLIPRPETELLVELALQQLAGSPSPTLSPSSGGGEKEGMGTPTIIDIGTGTGCIAVTLARELPNRISNFPPEADPPLAEKFQILAIDTSPATLRIARTNAQRHGVAQRISFVRGNLLEPALRVISRARPEKSHIIHGVRSLNFAPFGRSARDDAMIIVLANLPYVTTAEWRALPRSIRDYEPREALDGGPDGLKYFRMLFRQLQSFTIHHSPFTILEVDPRRKPALTALIRKTLPTWRASWHRDLSGRYRVLSIQY